MNSICVHRNAPLDARFGKSESKLKTLRKHCGLTQEELAHESGVSLITIRAYERKSKDTNKAQLDIVLRLAKALRCNITELSDETDPDCPYRAGFYFGCKPTGGGAGFHVILKSTIQVGFKVPVRI